MKNLLIKIASIATELDYAGLTKEAEKMHSVFMNIAKFAQNHDRLYALERELAAAQKELFKAENEYFREMEKMEDAEYKNMFFDSGKPFEMSQSQMHAGRLLAKKENAEKRVNYVLERLKNEGEEQIFELMHANPPKVSPKNAKIFEDLARNFLREEEDFNDYISKVEMEKYQQTENKNLITRQKEQ